MRPGWPVYTSSSVLLCLRDERIINHKLAEAVERGAEGLNISWEGLRRTKGGAAADLTISEGGASVKYNVYLRGDAIVLEFHSTDQSRVELAARLLRLAGISAEVKRKSGGDVWRVTATTDMLAAGHEKLRKALAEIVREAVTKGWIDAGKAEGWLEKLEGGVALKEDWPMYYAGLAKGALMVRFTSTDSDSIQREAQRLEKMGLKRGVHFTVKMPEEGRFSYVSILREGLEHAAWLSVHGSGEQQKLAAEFIEYILRRAEKAGKEVSEKAQKIIKEGKTRASLKLENFEGRVEVGGREYVVKVIGWSAEFDEGRSGRKLLRIKITAEVGRVEGEHIVDRVVHEYTITFSRRGKDNLVGGYAIARADAPDGREADAERFSALIKALTGREPKVYHMKDGEIRIECRGEHLEGFMRYKEFAGVIKNWLEETGR